MKAHSEGCGMKSATFKFDAVQRRTLAARFRLLPDDRVQSFLNRCEYAITEWRTEWPVGGTLGNKSSNTRLRALSDAIHEVRCEIERLPDGAACALWSNWQYAHRKDITNLRVPEMLFLAQLLELEQMASELAGNMAHVGGIVKYCEHDLIDRLVQAFMDSSFNRKPSAAPNGMFMRFLGDIADMLKLPDGGELTLGKHLVDDSIKWHLAREEQLSKWNAGMYEFPQSEQGS
jgi:hypothetical protein